eukprot:2100944-Amphidinium_carterae.1
MDAEHTRRITVRGWNHPARRDDIVAALSAILLEARIPYEEVLVRGIRSERALIRMPDSASVWPALNSLREGGHTWKDKPLQWGKDSSPANKIMNGKLWSCR